MPSRSGPLFVDERDRRDMERLLSDYRLGRLGRGRAAEEEKRRSDPVIADSQTVMLLENLRVNKVAYAEKLKIDTTAYILDVVVLGWPEAAVETVQIRVGTAPSNPQGGSTTDYNIPLNATAEEFQEITGVTGEVTLGAQTVNNDEGQEVKLVPSRWRVRWGSKDDAEPIFAGVSGQRYMTRVEETQLVGTGKLVKVIQTLPTGWDTPLRAGAICEAIRADRKYYKVLGAEARFWYGTEITSGAT